VEGAKNASFVIKTIVEKKKNVVNAFLHFATIVLMNLVVA
jgi:hypothetical protein